MKDTEKLREFAPLDDLADKLEAGVRFRKLRRKQLVKAAGMIIRSWKDKCPDMLFNMWARAVAANAADIETDIYRDIYRKRR